MITRLHEKYRKEAVPALTKKFGYSNMMAVPRVSKVTVNIGLGEASQNVKLLDTAAQELGLIAGQKPVITRAKKSIANFKIRKGMPIGCMVTLRGERMYEFLDRLSSIVLPPFCERPNNNCTVTPASPGIPAQRGWDAAHPVSNSNISQTLAIGARPH